MREELIRNAPISICGFRHDCLRRYWRACESRAEDDLGERVTSAVIAIERTLFAIA